MAAHRELAEITRYYLWRVRDLPGWSRRRLTISSKYRFSLRAKSFRGCKPIRLNQRQQYAWFYDGDGMKLMNEFGKKFNVYSLVGGGTRCQMGGWFRKEIKEVADLKGLNFRVGGFAGLTIEKLGGIPQQIAGGDFYPALERGMRPNGSDRMTTRSSASARSRSITTIRDGGREGKPTTS
jgi:hypothetical protein